MANLQASLDKFLKEREEIHKKLKPLKELQKPLSKRLMQVTRNIQTLKYKIRQDEIQ